MSYLHASGTKYAHLQVSLRPLSSPSNSHLTGRTLAAVLLIGDDLNNNHALRTYLNPPERRKLDIPSTGWLKLEHHQRRRATASYLRQPGYGLFFEATRNHDAWLQPTPLSKQVAASAAEFLRLLDARFPVIPEGDASAETLETDPDEVEAFRNQIERKSFEVPDSTATVKTRGSAQKAFADAVKANYGYRCAITGITTKEFLIAAHIVPWSKDQTIRLDPSNGICLSLLVDRAFEKGYLLIEDDHTIRIDWDRVGDDDALRSGLEPYEGRTLNAPAEGGPKLEYLQRRRALIVSTN